MRFTQPPIIHNLVCSLLISASTHTLHDSHPTLCLKSTMTSLRDSPASLFELIEVALDSGDNTRPARLRVRIRRCSADVPIVNITLCCRTANMTKHKIPSTPDFHDGDEVSCSFSLPDGEVIVPVVVVRSTRPYPILLATSIAALL